MRPLQLDYLREGKRALAAVFILGAFALAFAVDAGLYFARLGDDVALKEVRLAKALQGRTQPSPARMPLSVEEVAFARDTLRRLATPWDSLFRALEAAKSDQVALLALEPNVESRSVTISAEAKDYLAAISYVARLADEPLLKRVHLVRHEPRRNASQRRIGFTISASWSEE